MEEVKTISFPNTDYYQWGINCRLLRFSEKVTSEIITNAINYYQTIQVDIDLFWSGYSN